MKTLICIVPESPEEELPFYSTMGGGHNGLVRCPIHANLAELLKLKKGEDLMVIYMIPNGDSNSYYFFNELKAVNELKDIGAVIRDYDTVVTDVTMKMKTSEYTFDPITGYHPVRMDPTIRPIIVVGRQGERKQLKQQVQPKSKSKLHNQWFVIHLIDKIPENAELYIDVTYGSKAQIFSLLCALKFVEEYRNADVQRIIYAKPEIEIDQVEKPEAERIHPVFINQTEDTEAEQIDPVSDEDNTTPNYYLPTFEDITSTYHFINLIGILGTTDKEKARNMFLDIWAL